MHAAALSSAGPKPFVAAQGAPRPARRALMICGAHQQGEERPTSSRR